MYVHEREEFIIFEKLILFSYTRQLPQIGQWNKNININFNIYLNIYFNMYMY